MKKVTANDAIKLIKYKLRRRYHGLKKFMIDKYECDLRKDELLLSIAIVEEVEQALKGQGDKV